MPRTNIGVTYDPRVPNLQIGSGADTTIPYMGFTVPEANVVLACYNQNVCQPKQAISYRGTFSLYQTTIYDTTKYGYISYRINTYQDVLLLIGINVDLDNRNISINIQSDASIGWSQYDVRFADGSGFTGQCNAQGGNAQCSISLSGPLSAKVSLGVLDTNGRPIFAAVVLVPTATGTGGVANASYIAGLTTVPPGGYFANVYDTNFNLCKSVTVNPYDDLMAYCPSGVGKVELSNINTKFEAEIINNATVAAICGIDPPGGSCSIPTQPPTSQPPTSQPPTSQPPTSQPPTSQPPTSQPPTSQPPTSQPPTSQPPSPSCGCPGDIQYYMYNDCSSVVLNICTSCPGQAQVCSQQTLISPRTCKVLSAQQQVVTLPYTPAVELQSPTNVKYFELKNRPFECFISVENPVLGMALLIAFIVTVAVVSRI